jgi:phosphopantothenoylcysteine decarboxylase/phosphopantothenate--cysteine ligase
MGIALAEEAARRGASVTLVLGPSSLTTPPLAQIVRVRSAAEMHAAVMTHATGKDVVIMAAAVADYTPAGGAEPQKINKKADVDGLTLTLVKTRDILADLGRARASAGTNRPVLVGFAAETQDVIARARGKLSAKAVDMIVANDVSRADAGFEVETNAATLVTHADAESLPLQSKREMAGRILDRVAGLLEAQPAPQSV